MPLYSVANFEHDLGELLAPHSITIAHVSGGPAALTIDTRRINGTELHRTFTVRVSRLQPPMATHFADMVHLWYAAHH
jgi:hypothetical protein